MTQDSGDKILWLREKDRKIAELRERGEPLNAGGGGGTSGDVTDDWKASVDRQLGQLHGDVRNLLYGLVGGFLIILASGAGAYLRLDGKLEGKSDALRADISALQVQQAKMDAKLDLLVERSTPTKP